MEHAFLSVSNHQKSWEKKSQGRSGNTQGFGPQIRLDFLQQAVVPAPTLTRMTDGRISMQAHTEGYSGFYRHRVTLAVVVLMV